VIKSPTVFILGAGASVPFGFPVGCDLRDDIVKKLSDTTTTLFVVLRAAGFDDSQITRFREALQKSGQPSVDVFLEQRSEFTPIGKVAIAASLIPYEDEAKLWGGAQNWYEHVWKHLGPSLMDDVAQSQLSVITFNYDRSLEHFLYSALRNSFNIGTEDAARYLREVIRVVHVHGKLGELPFARARPDVTRAYQPGDRSNLAAAAVAAAKTIKIVHEGTREDPEFVQARQLLAQAEIVCFLGFGYLEANVERLGITTLPSTVQLYGTGYRFMSGEQTQASKVLGGRLNIGDPQHDSLAFLRQHGLPT